ncbi:MAG: squalene/phytoene synthase family protein [Gammaproteobacteria bacterium]|nr:squalene/phytoene synthase family protein [Gammaproteobacteria bacterium]MDH5801046.1 squalene/phytoene synthase family protein [Gammaproteobacteria bacterium]
MTAAPADKAYLLSELLKQVSRSFYLTLRALPIGLREPVSVAYLLARAADTVADTDLLPHHKRLRYIERIQQGLDQPKDPEFSNSLQELIRDTTAADTDQSPHNNGNSEGETQLLAHLQQVYTLFDSLPEADRQKVATVVQTLTSGMVLDLNTFQIQAHNISCLQTAKDLDRYTYLVAGCVGDFWTRISIAHYSALNRWSEQHYVRLGVNYGKALQLTNILRDVPEDLRLGRCYLPQDQLNTYGLSSQQLLHTENSNSAQPLLRHWLSIALSWYRDGQTYCLDIPKSCFRLRLASVLPLSIGLATLEKLALKQNWLDSTSPVKVSRRWVYMLLLFAPFLVSSNRLLHWWFTLLYQKADAACRCKSET